MTAKKSVSKMAEKRMLSAVCTWQNNKKMEWRVLIFKNDSLCWGDTRETLMYKTRPRFSHRNAIFIFILHILDIFLIKWNKSRRKSKMCYGMRGLSSPVSVARLFLGKKLRSMMLGRCHIISCGWWSSSSW